MSRALMSQVEAVPPPRESAKSAGPVPLPLDDPAVERIVARGPWHHSWRYAPPKYTALSCVFFLLFFYQPYWLRQAVWGRVRPLVADERLFYLLGSLCVHSAVFLLSNAVMAVIYWAGLPFFEQFKIQSDKPWPWRSSDPKERAAYFALIRKTILLISFNVILQAVTIYLGYPNSKARGLSGDPSTLPTWSTSLWQIGVCMLVEDTLFYWAHRTLHHPWIYRHVHKVHHQYRVSVGLASEYAHPFEFIVSNGLPFIAGPLLLGVHYWTLWQWTILRIGETVDGHCGYEFPWSPYRLLPFSGSSTAHDFHHSHNVGNFASFFTWWDALCGTDQAFLKHQRKVAAMQAARQGQREAVKVKERRNSGDRSKEL